MNQIRYFFENLLGTSDWPARWHCGKWSDFHGWLYITSDLLIWGAYFAIPAIIIKYISRKRDARFIRIYLLFALFILACGATHFLDAVMFWVPLYRLSALIRAFTAIFSWLTVFYLVRLLPTIFSLQSPQKLEEEIELRKKVEAELIRTNARLMEAEIMGRFGSFEWDVRSDTFSWSKGMMNLYEVEGQVQKYEDYLSQVRQEEREDMNRQVQETLSEKTYPDHYRTITTSRGKVRVLFFRGAVDLDERGEVMKLVGTAQDVTETKQLEADLRNHIEKIDEFNRIIGHNLRGPATSLINLADYVMTAKDEEDTQFLLSKVRGTAELIIQSLDDLKAYIEIRLTPQTANRPVSFEKALAQSLHLLEDEIRATQARLQVHFVVPEVDFPKVYLESILFNLVSNAIKYQPPGQQPLVIITTARDGNETVLRVQDNGIGINLNRHKDDLFKYKKVFHSGYKSNGLGLFLTKNQVEVYGGRIEVDSEVGRGSTFSVYFQKIPEDRALIY